MRDPQTKDGHDQARKRRRINRKISPLRRARLQLKGYRLLSSAWLNIDIDRSWHRAIIQAWAAIRVFGFASGSASSIASSTVTR